MAGIIGLLDLLSCDTLTSEQEISVSQIRRCATGLLALVNNVLDISKVIFRPQLVGQVRLGIKSSLR